VTLEKERRKHLVGLDEGRFARCISAINDVVELVLLGIK